MSKYFEDALVLIREHQLERLASRLRQVFAENASKGLLSSGSTIGKCRRVTTEEIAAFGDEILKKLTEIEPAFSPVEHKDFALAKSALAEFKLQAEAAYFAQLRPLRDNTPGDLATEPFGEAKAALGMSLSKLEGRRLEFHSRRSFWKWAWGDFRKRLWSGLLLVCGAAILWVLQQLAPMIIETFSRLIGTA